jgi:hypothetical protein
MDSGMVYKSTTELVLDDNTLSVAHARREGAVVVPPPPPGTGRVARKTDILVYTELPFKVLLYYTKYSILLRTEH